MNTRRNKLLWFTFGVALAGAFMLVTDVLKPESEAHCLSVAEELRTELAKLVTNKLWSVTLQHVPNESIQYISPILERLAKDPDCESFWNLGVDYSAYEGNPCSTVWFMVVPQLSDYIREGNDRWHGDDVSNRSTAPEVLKLHVSTLEDALKSLRPRVWSKVQEDECNTRLYSSSLRVFSALDDPVFDGY